MLAACLYRTWPAEIARAVFRARRLLLAGAVIGLGLWGGVFILVLHAWDWSAAHGLAHWGPPWFALEQTVLELLFAVIVLTLFVTRPAPRRAGIVSACILQCSLLSYSIYLVHLLVVGWTWFELPLLGHAGAAKLLLQFVLTFAVAACTYNGIELPFLRLRDAITGRRTRPPVEAAPIPVP